MEVEYKALLNNDTWSLVIASADEDIVHSKWIFRIKTNHNRTIDRCDTKPVVKGFQQTLGLDFFETYSPIVKAYTIKVIFTLVITFGWDI